MTDSPRDLALLFKKIEGNRQALTSVWETTIATPAYFLLSNFKCWKKSKNKRTSLSRIWQHSSHLVPTCEISFYDCCEFFLDFIHSSCSKMALNVFQQMLFLREEWTFMTLFHFWKLLIRDSQYKNYPLVVHSRPLNYKYFWFLLKYLRKLKPFL